ncbi:hypothetical protein Tco_0701020 [Tanacetum coccineum]
MTTVGSRWGVVMSRNARFSDQVVELDFLYPSEGIHCRWESGYRITSMAATPVQATFILSIPRRKMMDKSQETLRTSTFPSTHVKALDIWKLLSDGAYIHICSDAKGMAQVVPLTLQIIVQKQVCWDLRLFKGDRPHEGLLAAGR